MTPRILDQRWLEDWVVNSGYGSAHYMEHGWLCIYEYAQANNNHLDPQPRMGNGLPVYGSVHVCCQACLFQ